MNMLTRAAITNQAAHVRTRVNQLGKFDRDLRITLQMRGSHPNAALQWLATKLQNKLKFALEIAYTPRSRPYQIPGLNYQEVLCILPGLRSSFALLHVRIMPDAPLRINKLARPLWTPFSFGLL